MRTQRRLSRPNLRSDATRQLTHTPIEKSAKPRSRYTVWQSRAHRTRKSNGGARVGPLESPGATHRWSRDMVLPVAVYGCP